MSIKLILPVQPERDTEGFWTHPDFPEWDEVTTRETVAKWYEDQGLEHAFVWFEDDAPEELQNAWMENGCADVAKWQPTVPQGEGWFVLSIHDTERSPVCIFARRPDRMGQMIEVKTAELSGPALDWAVAQALGWQMVRVPSDIDGNKGGDVLAPPDFSKDFQFPPRGAIPVGYFLRRWSTDWAKGGPLIEAHALEITKELDAWAAIRERYCGEAISWWPKGKTILVAACRAIVAAKLGNIVSVPSALLGKEGER